MTKVEFQGNFRKQYDKLMSGEIVNFPEGRVLDILMHLDYYKINTLMIQDDYEGSSTLTKRFYCKVDEATVKTYLKEKEQEMRIV